MKTTNITLDAGTTAFMDTINDKLICQARRGRLLTIGLVACVACTAILAKRVQELESKVEVIDDNMI